MQSFQNTHSSIDNAWCQYWLSPGASRTHALQAGHLTNLDHPRVSNDGVGQTSNGGNKDNDNDSHEHREPLEQLQRLQARLVLASVLAQRLRQLVLVNDAVPVLVCSLYHRANTGATLAAAASLACIQLQRERSRLTFVRHYAPQVPSQVHGKMLFVLLHL